jgi:BirA family biotin operon repressor/biotin-[acetyl-CoA-carboxylase] ligase
LPQPPVHNTLGIPFIELQSVDSTNNFIKQLVHEKEIKPGTTVFAHEQVSGKGQRGKTWRSEKDANIILSILIDPHPVPLSMQFHLSATISTAVHEFFSIYAGDDTSIKWPNDLYWRDRKAGGILIENIVGRQESGITKWQCSIVGIGININQTTFPPELANPVSLKQITGKNFNPVELSKELCQFLDKKFLQLISGGYEKIYKEYLTYLYKINKQVKLKKGNRVFDAIIKGVSPEGKLITQHSIEEEFVFGEIEWLEIFN